MALPSSGQISFGDMNVEAERTRNSANTKMAGGSPAVSGSLVYAFAQSGVSQTSPFTVTSFKGKTYLLTLYISSSVVNSSTGQVKFTTMTGSCAGYVTSSGCQVSVYYSYLDGSGARNGTASIASTTSSTNVTLSPFTSPLSSVIIDTVFFTTGSCSRFNSTIQNCDAPL